MEGRHHDIYHRPTYTREDIDHSNEATDVETEREAADSHASQPCLRSEGGQQPGPNRPDETSNEDS